MPASAWAPLEQMVLIKAMPYLYEVEVIDGVPGKLDLMLYLEDNRHQSET
jgi:hypothetical protein